MKQDVMRRTALAFVTFGVVSCGDTTTEPETTADAIATPELAVPSNTWITRADMPGTARFRLTTAVVTTRGQSVLYAIGGRTADGSISRVQAYDVATNSWRYRAPLPVPAYDMNGAGVINGRIYVSGGVTGSKFFRHELFMYDPATNTWTQKSSMPASTWGGLTGVINNQLYVLTCELQLECGPAADAFYRYDPVTDRWDRLPLPPATLVGLKVAGTIGGKFYVTGGSTQIGVYDPATNQWTIKSAARHPASIHGGVAVQAKLFALEIQGQNPDGTSATVMHTYDPGTNAWTSRAPVNIKVPAGPLSRVFRDGSPRIEIVGGPRPGNNRQYIP